MKYIYLRLSIAAFLISLLNPFSFGQKKELEGRSPADELPHYIRQVTWFGERADWSPDGKKFLFLEKTYGDVYEYELETEKIRCLTNHYYHGGYTRALYLSNGDILLSGCTSFDAGKPMLNRYKKAELWVLDTDVLKAPTRLGTPCYEGPAVSRTQLKIAWVVSPTQTHDQEEGQFRMYLADIEYDSGVPELKNKRLILDNKKLSFYCRPETQNFRPPGETELIFSAYDYQESDVMGLNLETGEIVNYSDTKGVYQEPEGIFPDGKYTLMESDEQNGRGWKYVDIWKLKLDGSRQRERLTFFSDYPGFKGSNPVVSDDGRYMAFQIGSPKDAAGVGRGIFIYDLKAAKKQSSK
jgi:Tol biopolymer transport system component